MKLFTKTQFKLGMDCPTKLYYSEKDEYVDISSTDPFLEALANGGYQVGELAKCEYPQGVEVETHDIYKAYKQTQELLTRDTVEVFEAALVHGSLAARVDILMKRERVITLLEVKSKSYDDGTTSFMTKKGSALTSKWAPYLYDIAFQHYIASCLFPDFTIESFLVLVDKQAICTIDGLNSKFKVVNHPGAVGKVTIKRNLEPGEFVGNLLTQVSVEQPLKHLFSIQKFGGTSFVDHINFLASINQSAHRTQGKVGKRCHKCQFYPKVINNGQKSGFAECWKHELGLDETTLIEPTVLDLWNFKSADKLIEKGKILLKDLTEDDISPTSLKKPGLSNSERHWLQVAKVQDCDSSPYIDQLGLIAEMATWKFPLHFIDFETCSVALPFTKGRHPYEGIAFQFSHHTVDEKGIVTHAGEFLNVKPGDFPNYEFIAELQRQLSKDAGTIFRYSAHENTYLNTIHNQLEDDTSIEAHKQQGMMNFIKSITHSTKKSLQSWSGERDMVDLWELVKRYYYDPHTNGSTSIKAILPAIINSSTFIKEKYTLPIYGAMGGIISRNFKDHIWVKEEEGELLDPYKQLPTLFQDISAHDAQLLFDDTELSNGGAALTAYAKLQFTEMSDYEREALSQGLLKYCELDTLAMVMIYEAWREWCH